MKISIEEIVKSFDISDSNKSIKVPKTVWRVKINGKYVSTLSKKTVWKRIGDAKNAIRNHIETFCCLKRNWNYSSSCVDELYEDLITKGYIEFVELPIEALEK